MIEKSIELIDILDLQLLIDNEIGESKTLEYKSELHIDTDDERKEFLADVSSFANADGGDLIFGIEEDQATKLPSKLCGIAIRKSEDELIRQLESLVRDSVQPRIINIQYTLIPNKDSNGILIMRIPSSSFAPHRVIYKGHDRFYTRNSTGKYPMDVNELRAAFNLSQELSDRIENYKLEDFAV